MPGLYSKPWDDDPALDARAGDLLPASDSDVAGAVFRQQLRDNPTPALVRMAERQEGTPDQDASLSEEDLAFGGQLPYLPPSADQVDQQRAQMDAAKHLRSLRTDTVARAQGLMSGSVARAGVGLVAGALDPINLAASFIPGANQARIAESLGNSFIARSLARGVSGAAGGAIGGVATAPIEYFRARAEGDDWTMGGALAGVAFGSVLGGALHTSLGALGEGGRAFLDWRRGGRVGAPPPFAPAIDADAAAARNIVAEHVDGQPTTVPAALTGDPIGEAYARSSAAERVDDDPELGEAALRSGVAQLAEGRPVEVSPLLTAAGPDSPASRETIARYLVDQGRAALRPGADLAAIRADTFETLRGMAGLGERDVADDSAPTPADSGAPAGSPASRETIARYLVDQGRAALRPGADLAAIRADTFETLRGMAGAGDRAPPQNAAEVSDHLQPADADLQPNAANLQPDAAVSPAPIDPGAAVSPAPIDPGSAVIATEPGSNGAKNASRLARQRGPTLPQSLTDFLATKGGLARDPGGDLNAIGADTMLVPGRGRLVRAEGPNGEKRGLSLDYAREAAEEAGFLPEGSSTADLLDALAEEASGRPQYRPGDDELARQIHQQRAVAAARPEVNRRLRATGVALDPDIRDIAAELVSRGTDVDTAIGLAREHADWVARSATDAFARAADPTFDPEADRLLDQADQAARQGDALGRKRGADRVQGLDELNDWAADARKTGVLAPEDERLLDELEQDWQRGQGRSKAVDAAATCLARGAGALAAGAAVEGVAG